MSGGPRRIRHRSLKPRAGAQAAPLRVAGDGHTGSEGSLGREGKGWHREGNREPETLARAERVG